MGLVMADGVLTTLSYLAYRRSGGQSSYQLATIGFGLVVLGSLVDPAYLFGRVVDVHLNRHELLLLSAIEDLLLAGGLGIVFLGIIRHDSSTSSSENDAQTRSTQAAVWNDEHWSDQ